MNKLQRIVAFYEDAGIEFTAIEGFDKAVIGVEEHDMRLVYSRSKIIKILMNEQGMDELEAREWFAYNIWMGYVGPSTPIFCLDDM